MKHIKTLEEKITIRDTLGVRLKDQFNRVMLKLVKGFRSSKDKVRFPQGVGLEMRIDKQKDQYDQVVVDNKTNKVRHEEHMRLSKHNLSNED